MRAMEETELHLLGAVASVARVDRAECRAMPRLKERKEGQQKRTYNGDCVQDVSACCALKDTLRFITLGDRDRDIAPGNAVGNLQICRNHATHISELRVVKTVCRETER